MKYLSWLLALIVGAGCVYATAFFVHYKNSEIQTVVNVPLEKPTLNLKPSSEPVTLIAVGDVMLGRNVELLMDRNGDTYPFLKVADFLQSADAVIANLEGPITIPHVRTPGGSFMFTFHERMAGVLKDNNIGIVSLANNHTLDGGQRGYETTARILKEAGVASFGHPTEISNSYVLRTKVKHQPLVLIGFNITYGLDTKAALELVKGIPKKSGELYIVEVHGGEEYALSSNADQQAFYRGLIDAGATVVIGHHPHVVQEIELYKDKVIFYSLGNFIFDQYFSQHVEQGLALKMTILPSTITYELVPVAGNHSQPTLMAEKTKTAFLNSLASRSSSSLNDAIIGGSITQQR